MSISKEFTEKLIKDMCAVATRCGEIILAAGEHIMSVKKKSSYRDLVTEYDMRVQEYAQEALVKLYPQACFFCEESNDGKIPDASMLFVIDPIDGTVNFIHGLNHSCTSIACLIDGKPVAGVIYNPYAKEMFCGADGFGAKLNGRDIRATESELLNTLVIFGTAPYNDESTDVTFDHVRDIYDLCLDVRRSGSAALDLCDIACGRVGLFFESSLSLWDYAAGAIILKQAGGVCFDLAGEEISFAKAKSSVLAGTSLTISQCGLL